jgi:hypothetical protein
MTMRPDPAFHTLTTGAAYSQEAAMAASESWPQICRGALAGVPGRTFPDLRHSAVSMLVGAMNIIFCQRTSLYLAVRSFQGNPLSR